MKTFWPHFSLSNNYWHYWPYSLVSHFPMSNFTWWKLSDQIFELFAEKKLFHLKANWCIKGIAETWVVSDYYLLIKTSSFRKLRERLRDSHSLLCKRHYLVIECIFLVHVHVWWAWLRDEGLLKIYHLFFRFMSITSHVGARGLDIYKICFCWVNQNCQISTSWNTA